MNADDHGLRIDDYLAHMLEGAQLVRKYVDGMSKEEFIQDRRTQQAVILNLIVVGEAATRLCGGHEEFVSKHPEIPWRQMRGMRNRMAHGYFDINLDVVWETIQVSLPELEVRLLQLRGS